MTNHPASTDSLERSPRERISGNLKKTHHLLVTGCLIALFCSTGSACDNPDVTTGPGSITVFCPDDGTGYEISVESNGPGFVRTKVGARNNPSTSAGDVDMENASKGFSVNSYATSYYEGTTLTWGEVTYAIECKLKDGAVFPEPTLPDAIPIKLDYAARVSKHDVFNEMIPSESSVANAVGRLVVRGYDGKTTKKFTAGGGSDESENGLAVYQGTISSSVFYGGNATVVLSTTISTFASEELSARASAWVDPIAYIDPDWEYAEYFQVTETALPDGQKKMSSSNIPPHSPKVGIRDYDIVSSTVEASIDGLPNTTYLVSGSPILNFLDAHEVNMTGASTGTIGIGTATTDSSGSAVFTFSVPEGSSSYFIIAEY